MSMWRTSKSYKRCSANWALKRYILSQNHYHHFLSRVLEHNLINLLKYVDVNKLIKAKYQDNLEFLQWIKRYFDLHFPGGNYNAVERRAQSKCPYEGDGKAGGESAPKPAAKVEGMYSL